MAYMQFKCLCLLALMVFSPLSLAQTSPLKVTIDEPETASFTATYSEDVFQFTIIKNGLVLYPTPLVNSVPTVNPRVNASQGANVSPYFGKSIYFMLHNTTMNDTGTYNIRVILVNNAVNNYDFLVTVRGLPILVQQLSNTTAVAGGDASMRCGSWAIPGNITYDWTQNNALLAVNSSRFTYYYSNSTFIIQDVVKSDTGLYRCQPKNVVGNGAFSEAYLEVLYGPEGLTMSPNTPVHTVKESETLTLSCSVADSGNPAAEIKLTNTTGGKNDIMVQGFNSISYPFVVFPHFHENTYECSITNAYGTLSSSVQLDVQTIPIFTNTKATVTANEGTTVTLTCSATALPTPVLTLLSPMNETISSDNSSASYSFTVNSTYDKAMYTCRAINPAGTKYTTTVLNIQYKPIISSNQARAYEITSGSDTIMNCLAVGNPTSLKYFWAKSYPLDSNPPSNTIYDQTTGNLTIPNVQLSATGNYTCVISNTVGLTNLVVKLTVLEIPVVVTANSSASLRSFVTGKKATVTCVMDGGPAPTITWTINGVAIVTGSGSTSNIYSISNTNTLTRTTSVLSISNPTTAIDGTLQCNASNQLGSDSYAITITVVDRSVPEAPSNFLVTETTSDTATFSWTSGHDGNLAQIFQLFYRRSVDTFFSFGGNTSFGQTTFTLTGLNSSTNYTAFIRGLNSLGQSPSSSSIQFATLQGAIVTPAPVDLPLIIGLSAGIGGGIFLILIILGACCLCRRKEQEDPKIVGNSSSLRDRTKSYANAIHDDSHREEYSMSTTDSLRHTQKQYPGAHYNEADMNGDAPGRDANSHSQLYLPIYNTVKDNVSTEPPTDPYRTTLERHRSNPTDAVDYSSTQNLVHENDKHYSDSNSVYASHTYEGYASTTDPTYAQVEKKKKIPRTFDDLNRLPPSSGNDPYSTYPRNPNNQAPYNPRQSTDSNIYGTVHKEPAQLPVEQAPEIVQPRQNQRNSTKRQQSEYEDIEAAHFNPAYENQDYGSASLPRHFRPQGTVDDDASKELML